jgi:hypothetical protein
VDCRRLGLYKCCTVGWSAGDECVGGIGSVVTALVRMRGDEKAVGESR